MNTDGHGCVLRRTIFVTTMIAMFVMVAHARTSTEGGLSPRDLRCEYLVDPMGVEEAAPRLSWTLVADRRAEVQTAYRVLVATSPNALANDQGDLWDSGKVASSQTAHIEYAGKPLTSRLACFWKVQSWNRDGEGGPWSETAKWEMGLLRPEDWSAEWIDARPIPATIHIKSAVYRTVDSKVKRDVTKLVQNLLASHAIDARATNAALGGDPLYGVRKELVITYTSDSVQREATIAEDAAIWLPGDRLPYLRKSFTVENPIRSARLFATALGVYELSLNGTRVGDQYLAPGWTDYRKRIRYQVYDVTSQLQQGANALGAVVAPGWFCGHAGLFNAVQFYGDAPALLTQLEITFEDGTTQRIVSDDSWKQHKGPWLQADLLKGETYDATAAIADWNSSGFDANDWLPTAKREESRNLQSDISEPIRVIAELPSKVLTEPAPGRWTFDLAQNMVGVIRLRIQAPRGTTITIRHAEMLKPDGTIYTDNLRAADSTDRYICSGNGVETWQPRFTFHGFRYVELTGLPSKPEIDAVTGIVLSSDTPIVGEFECSDPRINQLQSNIVWGLRGNYLSIPTDCPQRDERMGWMADAQVFLPTAMLNADVAAFMTKWMTDVTDAQRADGAHSDVAPAMNGLNYGTPAWGDAGVIVAWLMYRHYGDKRILERNIDSMIRWVQWCKTNSTDLIRDKARGNDYGDWLSINADTPKDLIGTAYFAHAADIVARSLATLGREDESAQYRELFHAIRKAFLAKYLMDDGRLTGDTQCNYVLALQFDLLHDAFDGDGQAIRHLAEAIEAKNNHLSTGFVGVSHLLNALTEHDRVDIAYRLLMQDTFPSWLFQVKHGATTIWERWNGWTPETGVHPDASMNSFNHYALGSCGQWMFANAAGIGQEADSRGFDRPVIRPRIGGGLTSACGKHRSMHGEIACEWAINNGTLTIDVTIPVNTTARVMLPVDSDKVGLESGKRLEDAEGVAALRKNGELTLRVESGSYRFTMPWQ